MARLLNCCMVLAVLIFQGCDAPKDDTVTTTDTPDQSSSTETQEEEMVEESAPVVEETPEVPLPDGLDEDIFIPEGKVTKVDQSGELTVIEVETNFGFQDLLMKIREGIKAKNWSEKSYTQSPVGGTCNAGKGSREFTAKVSGSFQSQKSKVTISFKPSAE